MSFTIYRMRKDVFLNLKDHFTGEEAEKATAEFKTLVGRDVVRFIVDLGALTGYDKAARIRWQKVLMPMKSKIEKIYFIGEATPLIRMAASTVALAVGITMKFVKEQSDVPPALELS